MVETYGEHEIRAYWVVETEYGVTPPDPVMKRICAEGIEPNLDPHLIKVRGLGDRTLQAIKKGSFLPTLNLGHLVPSDGPVDFLQYFKSAYSLSVEVLYFKGEFASATDIISLLIKGCRLNTISTAVGIDDILKADVKIIGQNVLIGTAKVGASYFNFTGTVPFYDTYVKKQTTTLDRATGFKFEVKNNLKPITVIRASDSNILKYLQFGKQEASGEIDFEFETEEELEDVVDDIEFSLEFGVGGSPVKKFTFSNCKWDNVGTKAEDYVSLRAPFTAKDFTIT
jgi:hypothetical protein